MAYNIPTAPPIPPYYPPPPPAHKQHRPPAIGHPVQAQHPGGNTYPHQHDHHHESPTTYYPANQLPAASAPVSLGPQYCVGYAVDLVIVRKLLTNDFVKLLTNDFVVRDVKKNVLFEAKGKLFTLHDSRLLSDTSGQPVITLRRQEILTKRSRWKVYKGDSWEAGDLLFTAKTMSSVDESRTRLNVYLAHNIFEDVCDFWLEGSLTKDSCIVYVGDSQTNIAARMKKESRFLGKDKFTVRVSPNIDYAFVVGLILIFDAIKI